MSSDAPRLDPKSTSSGVPCRSAGATASAGVRGLAAAATGRAVAPQVRPVRGLIVIVNPSA
jgi:hypothetical protein